ncbi:Protein CBG26241 [Caenorhabditis briggsae]|uniref:Uncharacterized protein n=2 Tax=Caenorhabditis briggsae TaxID=6238 RepID=A0AAE9A9L1_CAEBR|nr:Protein CBG26241 [Caenorhabditis briggsae]ULT93372.1 hypothetical protein L3Y34_003099 [Caenorhabditis briggsae]UMM26631.1 hypothetical protein L5515_010253 [Caenorhabditis briggsae]CAS00892.1 Protein CBG26241 [Caenorhabditis briggsae]
MNGICEFFKAHGFTMTIVAGVIIIVVLATVASCKLAAWWFRKRDSQRLLQEIEMHQREKAKYQEMRDKMREQRKEAGNRGPSEAEGSETQPLTQDS